MEPTRDGAPKPDPLRGPVLEAGLKAAFGSSAADESNSRPSVVALLAKLGARAGRVLLREPRGEDEPLVKPAATAAAQGGVAAGHYQILGEIARGGIGVVLRGHDTELGRDVALKILRDDHRDNASLLERFIEEAQIGGQLQHPGIAPVYELGVSADLRPYFAMKLIKGESLAALLTRRTSPSDERRRFLGIFEQVCHTLAYAHARGVIHRDLKPANIMVGAFGEVQVVDWGLAKVLAHGGVADEKRSEQERSQRNQASVIKTVRSKPGSTGSDSVAGSVMGTPAYMSPEQARGQVEQLDERSDVFALGAILCELLTGAPPYVGERDDALALAAAAELERAFKSLDDCDADAELVAICKRCLSAKKPGRPRSAAELAAQTSDYLASVEERVRKAQIAAAQAEVKVQEERKARRLTLALAGSVLVTVVAVGGGWTWIHNKEFTRIANTERSVRAALADAALERGAKKYVESLAAVERAKALLDAGEAGDGGAALHEEVRETAAGVEAEAEAARKAAELEQGNRELLARLQGIRTPGVSGFRSASGAICQTDCARVDADYASAFLAADLHVDSSAVEDAAKSLRERRIDAELAAALDEWAEACRRANLKAKEAQLAQVAIATDLDDSRARLRRALAAGNAAELRSFAANADLRSLPAPTLALLASALDRVCTREESIAVYRSAQRVHPADFVLNLSLAQLIAAEEDDSSKRAAQANEAIAFFRAAIAARPSSIVARAELAEELFRGYGNAESAAMEVEEALRLAPDDDELPGYLGHLVYQCGDHARAVQLCRDNVLRHPQSGPALEALGFLLTLEGRHEEAVTVLKRAVEVAPRSESAFSKLGNALLAERDFKQAADYLKRAIEIDPTDNVARCFLGNALLNLGQVDDAIRELRESVKLDRGFAEAHKDLGDALLRAGNLDDAILAEQEAIKVGGDYLAAYCTLGIALSRKGRLHDAIEAYQAANRIDSHFTQIHDNLGGALAELGKNDEAVAEFREALRLKPDNACASANLATLFSLHPEVKGYDPEETLELAEKAVQLEDKHADHWLALGAARYRVDDWDEAVSALNSSLEREDKVAEVAYLLAMAHWKLGRKTDALKWFARATEWWPELATAEVAEPGTEADPMSATQRLREEAKQLMGIVDESPTPRPEGAGRK